MSPYSSGLPQIKFPPSSLLQRVCACLGAATPADAAALACCRDDLLIPRAEADVTPAVMQPLMTWWAAVMGAPDPVMTDQLYFEMLVR